MQILAESDIATWINGGAVGLVLVFLTIVLPSHRKDIGRMTTQFLAAIERKDSMQARENRMHRKALNRLTESITQIAEVGKNTKEIVEKNAESIDKLRESIE